MALFAFLAIVLFLIAFVVSENEPCARCGKTKHQHDNPASGACWHFIKETK
tara:strand:- start:61502 stop:61654 length:153 start_codon:yes stop_codon:yes gene_type:complete